MIIAWWERHQQQIALARATPDDFGNIDEIASITRRIEGAAKEADEILRRYHRPQDDNS